MQGGPDAPRLVGDIFNPVGLATTFVVSGLCQVGEFEKGGEGFGDMVGLGHAHVGDDTGCLEQEFSLVIAVHLFGTEGVFQFPVPDGEASELLFGCKNFLSGLLPDHRAE